MSYLEVFGVLTGVGVDVSKCYGVETGAGVLRSGAELSLKNVILLILLTINHMTTRGVHQRRSLPGLQVGYLSG